MYDNYLNVNKKFKSSVNLLFDLGNKDKILQYIPTSDLCDVIKKYLKSILVRGEYKSTFLAGPYGKGKSYLMLVITYILSRNRNPKVIKELISKIKPIDDELAGMIEDIQNKEISLIPVVINNNESDDINQNFMLALRAALVAENLDSIIPDSTYTECIKQIELWETNKDFNLVEVCE